MKINVVLFAICAFVMVAAVFQTLLAQSTAKNVTLTGIVSCRQCRKLHPDKGWTNASCTHRCIRQGSDYVLVVGNKMYENKIYKLERAPRLFDKLAGEKATLNGHFAEDGGGFFVAGMPSTPK